MSITIMKSLNKAIVDQLKQLEIESCKNGEISFGSTAEITGMVHPEFRNQGYGKGLLENSIFELRKQGAKKIFLQVVAENENALVVSAYWIYN